LGVELLLTLDRGANLLFLNTNRGYRIPQTPPDLVVKFQLVDIANVILLVVLRQRVMYQRETKG
jgi:hypothetical protein